MKTIFSSRRQHYLARASIFLIMVALITGMVGCGGASFAGGSGTAEDPYQIANWHHLHNVRDYLSACFILINDLDSSTAGYQALAGSIANEGKGWQPIGTYDNPFTGSFDGQGYEIRDLFIDRPVEVFVGLFGVVYEGGVIQDISVVNITVTGYDKVGGLVGGNAGTINTCYSTGSVTGNNLTGGLVGGNAGTINTCYSTGSMTGNTYTGGMVGGSRNGTISDSYATGNVTGSKWIGGLVGSMNETTMVSNSYATGSVTGDYYAGGLVGASANCTVSNCYATGTVTGSINVGGLMGVMIETTVVSNSYATGSVNGDLSVGGLVGAFGDSTVSNCYATGTVTGANEVGGLVGYNYEGGTVSNSYSTGNVTGEYNVGGLVGVNSGTMSNSFWDTETSGQASSDGGTGKNTTEMQDIDTFSDTETEGLDEPWDITTVGDPGERDPGHIWNIVDDVTYPLLSWQPV